jgi:DNA mismatch repair protein MutH
MDETAEAAEYQERVAGALAGELDAQDEAAVGIELRALEAEAAAAEAEALPAAPTTKVAVAAAAKVAAAEEEESEGEREALEEARREPALVAS